MYLILFNSKFLKDEKREKEERKFLKAVYAFVFY